MQRDCDSGSTKDIQKTQLCSFRAKIGGTATILPVLSSFLMQTACTDTVFPVFSLPPIQLNLNLCWAGELFSFHPLDSLGPGPNQLIHCWRHFWRQAASLASCTEVSFSRKQLSSHAARGTFVATVIHSPHSNLSWKTIRSLWATGMQ